MNYRKITGIALFCLALCSASSAQSSRILNEPDTNKPQLFGALPNSLEIDAAELQTLATPDQSRSNTFSLNFASSKSTPLTATIISTASKYEGKMNSTVYKVNELEGAILTITAITQADGSITYAGRMISRQHGDLYELKFNDEKYSLIKKNYYELINE